MFKSKYFLSNGDSLSQYCKKHSFSYDRIYSYIKSYNFTPEEAIHYVIKLDFKPKQTTEERLIQERARIRMYNSPCSRQEALLPHNEYIKKMRIYRTGRYYSFYELGKKYGINPTTLYDRVIKQGLTLKEALKKPLVYKRDGKILKYKGKTLKSVLPYNIYQQINKLVRNKGQDLEQILIDKNLLKYF